MFSLNKGSSVGSLMDKGLSQSGLSGAFTKQMGAISKTRFAFKEGGSVDNIDQEIIELEIFVGLRPTNSYEAFLIEQMKDRLFQLYEIKKGNK